ncbi:MAG: DUF2946 family protein [Pseudomonadota bacterium]
MVVRLFAVVIACLVSLLPAHGVQRAPDGISLVICTPQGLSRITLPAGTDRSDTEDLSQDHRHCPACILLVVETPKTAFAMRPVQRAELEAWRHAPWRWPSAQTYRHRPRGPPILV